MNRKFLPAIFVAVFLIIFVNIMISSLKSIITSSATDTATVSLSIGAAPTPPPTPGPSAGGGGAVTPSVVYNFDVEPDILKVKIKQGETFKTAIKIKNTADIEQSFSLQAGLLSDSVIFSEDNFKIPAGKEKVIEVTFISTKETKLGARTGAIEISTSYRTKKVLTLLEIRSTIILVDVTLDIPAKYKNILPGEDVMLQLTLFNLGESGRIDVSVEYLVKDFEGNTLTKSEDVVAVETQATLSKILKLPETIKPGTYTAIAYVRYDESFATASDLFFVLKPGIALWIYVIVGIGLLWILILLIIYILHRRLKKMIKEQNREVTTIAERMHKGAIKLAEATKFSTKLKAQLALLERAYSGGYISRQAYIKGKGRIRNLYGEIKKKYL